MCACCGCKLVSKYFCSAVLSTSHYALEIYSAVFLNRRIALNTAFDAVGMHGMSGMRSVAVIRDDFLGAEPVKRLPKWLCLCVFTG